MSATSGWDTLPPPAPDLARSPDDHAGEPVGYDLGKAPLYEQPPVVMKTPAPPVPAVLSTQEATAGLVLSLVGVIATPVISFLNLPLLATGLIICTSSLRDIRRGVAAGRGQATSGVILAILGIVLTALLQLYWPAVMPQIILNP
jgi:hypothetical protein